MRITARWVGLLLAGAVLLVTGFTLGYPELTVIGTSALVALTFAVGFTLWPARLAVTRRAEPDRVSRDEPCQVELTARNASRLRVATMVAVDPCGPSLVPVPLVRLRPGHDSIVSYPVPTRRRGVVTLGPLRVVRRDPLGLIEVTRSHGEPDRVWVYPTAYPLAAVPAGVARSLDGRVDRVPHGSITFDTLREYVIGDELRHVHWRTTARIGTLMVREHVDTSLPRLVVLLDDRAAAYPPLAPDGVVADFESACEAAASIVLAALRADLAVSLHLVTGQAVAASSGRQADARPYLDLLAEVTPTTRAVGPDALAAATARLRHQRGGDCLIYLTGPGKPDDLAEVGALRGAYPVLVAGTLGATEPAGTADSGAPVLAGVVVLPAVDGAAFAAAWDGVGAW